MNCPKCHIILHQKQLSEQLQGFHCPKCQGHWMPFENYLHWQQSKKVIPDYKKTSEVNDYREALICPVCGKIMRKYQTTCQLAFNLDRCSQCNGIWFDQYEWDKIIEAGLCRQLHFIFTAHWQKKLKREKSALSIHEDTLKKLGRDDTEKVTALKEWIKNHPQRQFILGYLID